MNNLFKLSKLYELKRVDRNSTNGNRKESSAEHSWSCLILADYFLQKMPELDRLRIYELLIYHDILEIEIGDTPLHPKIEFKKPEVDTKEIINKFKNNLSEEHLRKIEQIALDYEFMKSKESKFAKAIDALDPMIQGIAHKEKWKHWTKEFLIEKKAKYFKEFPIIEKEFYQLLDKLEKEGYFKQ